MQRYDIVFLGRVQGVFFRATTRDLAKQFAVTGWVANEPDGSVRCVAEGAPGQLDRFLAAISDAKGANIDNTRLVKKDATGEFDGFSIRY